MCYRVDWAHQHMSLDQVTSNRNNNVRGETKWKNWNYNGVLHQSIGFAGKWKMYVSAILEIENDNISYSKLLQIKKKQ